MRCLQHVLWRGAMALSLLVAGIGSGYGLYEAPQLASEPVESCEPIVEDWSVQDAHTGQPGMRLPLLVVRG